MVPGQDWCMQCGHGAPGSMGERSWRPWAIALAATAVLVLGAAAAGYAALSKKPRHAAIRTATVAAAAPPPAPATPVTPATGGGTPTGGGQSPSGSEGGASGSEAQPAAILLDTDAASTYNPSALPAGGFGDPSLTIDGDPSTGWSAQVDPSTAPAMADGVLIDLKSKKKVSSVKLVTTTPGLTLQVFGASAQTAPASITDPAWAPLSRSLTIKKRHAKIGLHNKTKAYRFIVVWISGVPAKSVGTPEKPGRVTLNEVELFPAG
jgi:hypothetical protein